MTRILVAPNSMKGSLSAFDCADAIEVGFRSVSDKFEIKKVPVADGGDYTREVLHRHFKAEEKSLEVQGPLGELTASGYSVSGRLVIIEMADASGMKLVDSGLLNPLQASSFGTGQLIKDAIRQGCEEIFLAIGGSATVDGGMGMLEAMGFQFFDKSKKRLKGNGYNLAKVCSIQKPLTTEQLKIKVICDVDNSLLGPNGAAAVFGPQKGATPEMVIQLEKGLKNWVELLFEETGIDLKPVAGGGAAGGIAIPLLAFFDAELVEGTDFVLQQLNFEKQVKWADVVITGEGKIDAQTLNNKAPFGVAKMARKYKKPVVAIGGKVDKDASKVFDGVYSLVDGPVSLEYAMENSKELLTKFSEELAKTISVLRKIGEK